MKLSWGGGGGGGGVDFRKFMTGRKERGKKKKPEKTKNAVG